MTPLTAEEIAELRKMDAEATPPAWDHPGTQEVWQGRDKYLAFVQSTADADLLVAARNALPSLLDEVEQWRNPESVRMWRDENAATLERSRALLKRIEWSGAIDDDAPRWCQVCGGRETHPHLPLSGHRPGCELAALIGGTERAPDLRDEVERLRKLCALAAAELRGDRPDGTWDDTVFQLEQAASGVRPG